MIAGTAGCGGGGTPPPVSGAQGCTTLKAGDVAQVSGLKIDQKIDVASDPGLHIACSSLFGSGNDIVATITQQVGGAKTLQRVRTKTVGDVGADRLKPDSRLGPGAFVARNRILVFPHGKWVVTLQTGYSSTTHLPVLSVSKLERLAKIVSGRL